MRETILVVALLAALAAAPAGSVQARTSHAHGDAHSTTTPSKEQPAGRRWTTDAPLREGMARIKKSVDALSHARHGHLDPAQVRLLAAGIRKDVQFLVANCKLEPAADAALHGVIAQLLQHAATLEREPASAAAINGLQSAVDRYARAFDDPGFPARK